jgi:hypothetical protein
MSLDYLKTDAFEFDTSDGGAGEEIGPELARAYVPPVPRDTGRRIIVKVPDLPTGIDLPELAAAALALGTERARLTQTQRDLSLAEAKARAARQADLAAEVAAYREGKPAPAPSAATVAVEISKLNTQRGLGVTAVAQAEMEVANVLDRHRGAYLGVVSKAIETERQSASLALNDYSDARLRLVGAITLASWLNGQRKGAALPPLRGLVSSDRPQPSADAVLAALRRELTW